MIYYLIMFLSVWFLMYKISKRIEERDRERILRLEQIKKGSSRYHSRKKESCTDHSLMKWYEDGYVYRNNMEVKEDDKAYKTSRCKHISKGR